MIRFTFYKEEQPFYTNLTINSNSIIKNNEFQEYYLFRRRLYEHRVLKTFIRFSSVFRSDCYPRIRLNEMGLYKELYKEDTQPYKFRRWFSFFRFKADKHPYFWKIIYATSFYYYKKRKFHGWFNIQNLKIQSTQKFIKNVEIYPFYHKHFMLKDVQYIWIYNLFFIFNIYFYDLFNLYLFNNYLGWRAKNQYNIYKFHKMLSFFIDKTFLNILIKYNMNHSLFFFESINYLIIYFQIFFKTKNIRTYYKNNYFFEKLYLLLFYLRSSQFINFTKYLTAITKNIDPFSIFTNTDNLLIINNINLISNNLKTWLILKFFTYINFYFFTNEKLITKKIENNMHLYISKINILNLNIKNSIFKFIIAYKKKNNNKISINKKYKYLYWLTIHFKKKSLYVGLLNFDEQCLFSYTSGLFVPRLWTRFKPRFLKKQELLYRRSLKHKKKKAFNKKKIISSWKHTRRTFITKTFMLRYIHWLLTFINIFYFDIIIRGAPKAYKLFLRQLFFGKYSKKILIKKKWKIHNILIINKYKYIKSKKAIKRKLQKKITRTMKNKRIKHKK